VWCSCASGRSATRRRRTPRDQRVPLAGKANLTGSFEVFNLFNRKNCQVYDLTETSATFLQPQPSANLSYAPRTVQLGFRLTF